MTSFDEQIVRWTARAAMSLYAASLACRLRRTPALGRRFRGNEVFYLLGWGTYLVHVVCAYGLAHGWSRAAAYEHTALRTEALIGIRWEGGLWFNDLLTVVWTADVAWLLASPQSYRRRDRRIDYAVQSLLIFMALNAVVAFGPPTTRVVGLVVTALLLTIAWRRRREG